MGWLVVAAVALGLERACYVWIARGPRSFRAWCVRPSVTRLGAPVDIVRRLFYGFKVIQLAVFVGWCWAWGTLTPVSDPAVLAVGIGLMGVGQTLNGSVFYRLGAVGVFYGDRLGHEVPRCRELPLSLIAHPQYLGALLSIWGFFVTMRFPHDDWVLLPALETFYYVVGTYLEEPAVTATAYATGRSRAGVRVVDRPQDGQVPA
jgi:hypothetical protein